MAGRGSPSSPAVAVPKPLCAQATTQTQDGGARETYWLNHEGIEVIDMVVSATGTSGGLGLPWARVLFHRLRAQLQVPVVLVTEVMGQLQASVVCTS